MIVASHMGEDLVPTLLAAGAGSVTVLATLARSRLHELFRQAKALLDRR